jgi:hypothetical protein
MNKASKEQIQEWKKKHGEVFEVVVGDKVCYLHKPTRKILSFAFTKAQNDPLATAEVILENCWLGGDEEIKTDDDYFLGANSQIDKIIEVKEAEIKKL